MGSRTEAQDFVQDDLVGIPEIEITFLKPYDWGYIQGVTDLVVQEPVGDTRVVIVLKIVPPEFNVEVGYRPSVTFEQLEEDRRFDLQLAVLVLCIAVPRVYVVIPEPVGLKDGVEAGEVLVEQVGGIQTEIEFVLPVEHPHVKIVVGSRPVIGHCWIRTVKILYVDTELVEVVGDPEGEELVIIPVECQVVGKGQASPPLLGLPVAVIVEQHPKARLVPDPGIGGQGLGVRGILDPHPLGKSVDTHLYVIAYTRVGRRHHKRIVCQVLGQLRQGEFLPPGKHHAQ